MNLFDKFQLGQLYADFLARHASPAHKERWQQVHSQVALTPAQRDVLAQFRREMNVLVLAGAWCGDCINQCPIFEHFAAAAPVIRIRYLDRDEHVDAQEALRINGGNHVPVVVSFSEDGFEVARYGERTLSQYRQIMRAQYGAAGVAAPDGSLLAAVTQDWLNEFERVQWLLRLSARLRQKHGD